MRVQRLKSFRVWVQGLGFLALLYSSGLRLHRVPKDLALKALVLPPYCRAVHRLGTVCC